MGRKRKRPGQRPKPPGQGPQIREESRKRHGIGWWGVVRWVVCALLAASGWYVQLKDKWSPQFSVVAPFTVPGHFRCRNLWEDGWRTTEIAYPFYLKLTNVGSKPAEVLSYFLEERTAAGWDRLQRVDPHSPYILEHTLEDPTKPAYFDFSANSLDRRMAATVIDPGHSVEGWAFFAINPASRAVGQRVERFRMTLLDPSGRRTVQKFDAPGLGEKSEGSLISASLKVVPSAPWSDPKKWHVDSR